MERMVNEQKAADKKIMDDFEKEKLFNEGRLKGEYSRAEVAQRSG